MEHESHLLRQIIRYCDEDYYPFHMPGHKRQNLDFPNPWSVDITEIEGFDNLHHATGILKKLQEHAATVFGAKKSFCLVNGSTCGILAAISACVKPGGTLLMARNCHKSVYHGVSLRSIAPAYLMPERTDFGIAGSISPESAERAFREHPDVEALLVTSPTYDGVVSDITALADIAHRNGVPIIVDEAHGAHFPLYGYFPKSALECGADVVIHSLHKTLPAFTQTALLHLNSDRVNEDDIRRYLDIYQSSSPSYLLLSSIDQCLRLLEEDGGTLFYEFSERLEAFYRRSRDFQSVEVLAGEDAGIFARDPSKILISAWRMGLSGQKLARMLREKYHLEMEMAAGQYALALTSLMDTAEGFRRLVEALLDIDESDLLPRQKVADIYQGDFLFQLPEQAMRPSEAIEKPGHTVPLAESAGQISRESLYFYPPGIPLIAPGEIIPPDLPELVSRCSALGLVPEGTADLTGQGINVAISSNLWYT